MPSETIGRISRCIATLRASANLAPEHIVKQATCDLLNTCSTQISAYEVALRECAMSHDPHVARIAKDALAAYGTD